MCSVIGFELKVRSMVARETSIVGSWQLAVCEQAVELAVQRWQQLRLIGSKLAVKSAKYLGSKIGNLLPC